MSTALLSAGQGELARAQLEILVPTVPDPLIPLKFNPAEYKLEKTNNFAEIAIPGLESPPLQYVRGGPEKLSLELLADTSDTLKDVRVAYTDRLRELMRIRTELHAPPIVRFIWDREVFKGVLEQLAVTFVMFGKDGVPLRARLSVTLKEYRPVDIQVKESPTASPDFDKAWQVRAGDTLSSIALAVYKDPGQWRAIAAANRIRDPRHLEPGRVLALPRLR